MAYCRTTENLRLSRRSRAIASDVNPRCKRMVHTMLFTNTIEVTTANTGDSFARAVSGYANDNGNAKTLAGYMGVRA